MHDAVAIVQKFFPAVTTVNDAKEDLIIEVTKRDSNSAAVRKHNACAMAVACKRATIADGVIVSIGTVYIVKGHIAQRYKASEHMSREVVSFDRNAGFAPGKYTIKAPTKSQKLGGSKSAGSHGPHTGKGKPKRLHHFTSGIRTVLGSGLTGEVTE